jgi:hypothetical protein
MKYTKTYNDGKEKINVTIENYSNDELMVLPSDRICKKQKCICIKCDYSCFQCKDCGANGYVGKCSSFRY